MSDDNSRHRPLLSRQDLDPAERKAARGGTMIALSVAFAVTAGITALVLTSPISNDMIAMLGP